MKTEFPLNEANVLGILQYAADILHASVHVYRDSELLYLRQPQDLKDALSPFTCDPRLFGQVASCGQVYCADADFPEIHYGYTRREKDAVVIGPYACRHFSANLPLRYQKARHIPANRAFLLPALTDTQVMQVLHMLCFVLMDGSDDQGFDVTRKKPSPAALADPPRRLDHKRAIYHYDSFDHTPHYPYELELEFYKCIHKGDYDGLNALLAKTSEVNAGDYSTTDFERNRINTILMAALYPREAIKGGVNTYAAYEMSDVYLKECCLCKTADDFERLQRTVCYEVCMAVRNAQAIKSENILVEKCKTFVGHNLTKDVSLRRISEALKINASYLSNVFSKVEHLTLGAYIRREKINAASNMLKYSDYSIARIAEYMGFSSQSYFNIVFKKETGVTPSEFRKKNRQL